MIVPNEPRHTVHDVALERPAAERVPTPIRKLARSRAAEALEVLAKIMNDEEVTASTRVIAAIEVIDRAWGKARPASDDDADGAKRLETIRRIIVDPRHSDEPGLQPAPAAGSL
jgi:hypothetical protein